MEKLKPCPFCGGEAELQQGQWNRDGSMRGYVFARCTNCKAAARRVEYSAIEAHRGFDEQKASNLWNRRKG